MKQPAAFVIEPMRAEDIDAVMRIETACFPTPWTADMFLHELQRPQANISVLRRVDDGHVVAFINHWTVLDELHLLNVATLPEERRRGHGKRLLEHMFECARSSGCRVVMLEVRRSNESALGLYQSFGFKSVGVRPGYYSDNGEDALLMNLDLPQAPTV